MGRHRKQSRIWLPQGAAAAAPAIAGVAVTFCMSSQAPSAEAAVTRPPALATAYGSAGTWMPHAAIVRRRGTAQQTPRWYRVRAGDSLSSIAAHVYHDRADWTAIYWRNHRQIRWADEIRAGQVLRIPARPARPPAPPRQLDAPALAPLAGGSSAAAASGAIPGGAFGQCVIARESGGNAQIMNSTGHYGLYQFSAATWAAYGGNPADFGNASVAEQNQVFANALAAGGESNWALYDGC